MLYWFIFYVSPTKIHLDYFHRLHFMFTLNYMRLPKSWVLHVSQCCYFIRKCVADERNVKCFLLYILLLLLLLMIMLRTWRNIKIRHRS
jgi:hypothetical protein